MGGGGSGTWFRWDKRTTTDEVKRIDIRYLRKHGLLKPNHAGSLTWTLGGEPNGNISYTMFDDEMWLRYSIRRYGGEWEPVKQSIWFDETSCNYGGTRKWFSCPECDQRVAVLYHVDTLFLCRHCNRLTYASQGEGYLDRLIRKSDKIGARLDAEIYLEFDGYYKPKGMHWKTFYHLKMAENATDDRLQNALLARFGCYM